MLKPAPGTVRLQFKRYPFNNGNGYHDRITGHVLRPVDGQWKCRNCMFSVAEQRYLTWKGTIEDTTAKPDTLAHVRGTAKPSRDISNLRHHGAPGTPYRGHHCLSGRNDPASRHR
ncbi:hypothetical protein BJ970_002980 [Saccharopolyspora phatthalungensis]|uniref:Uncharacterized protein n=1 Tax=Saccharopolyspora phatthalungensis TaxID=664693 RepID=A0A840Q4P3_9PSEU|nr:hypothetical protein [Saccharopolyspora phatthalungensis]